jgi:branched-chain amino acid transport system ATP-binding protein
VLVQGQVLVEGSPDTVRDDPRVIEAYLGKPREEVEAEVAEARTTVMPRYEGDQTEVIDRYREDQP